MAAQDKWELWKRLMFHPVGVFARVWKEGCSIGSLLLLPD